MGKSAGYVTNSMAMIALALSLDQKMLSLNHTGWIVTEAPSSELLVHASSNRLIANSKDLFTPIPAALLRAWLPAAFFGKLVEKILVDAGTIFRSRSRPIRIDIVLIKEFPVFHEPSEISALAHLALVGILNALCKPVLRNPAL